MIRFTIVAPPESARSQPPSSTRSTALQNHWRSCESWTAFFSTLSLVPASIDYELHYSPSRTNSNCLTTNENTEVFRWLVVCLTLPAAFFLILRYLAKRQWLILKTSYLPRAQRSIRNYSRWTLLLFTLSIELLLLALFPYPHCSNLHIPIPEQNLTPTGLSFPSAPHCLLLSEFLYCLMYLRVFFLIRALLNYSGFNDVEARRVCLHCDVNPNFWFNVRAYARAHMWFFLMEVVALCWVAFGMTLRVMERPYATISTCDFTSFFNTFYFTLNTIQNAPYGDYWPQTHTGRGLSFILALLSMCLVSIAYTLLADYLDMSNREKDAFREIAHSRVAIRIIEAGYIYHAYREKPGLKVHKQWAKTQLVTAKVRFDRELPRLNWKIGLSERPIREKYGRLVELTHRLGRIESKWVAGCVKVEGGLEKTRKLLGKLQHIVDKR